MKWLPVQNLKREQPRHGVYSDWKDRIAQDCGRQCVYCAISEAQYGGIDNFHVEHFKPKSKFRSLTHRIKNLYLACAICNRFKGNDWPATPKRDHSAASYPDPGSCDYNDLFDADGGSLRLAGKFVASRYVVERLYLNRPQLLRERRATALEMRVRKVRTELTTAIDALLAIPLDEENRGLVAEIAKGIVSIGDTTERMRLSPPYAAQDIRRPKNARAGTGE